MQKRLIPTAMLMASVFLAGCQAFGGGTPIAAAPPPDPISGQWVDSSGVGTATLQAGRFTNVANDTGNKLAEGNYVLRSPTTVDLNFRSLVRNTDVAATCLIVDQNQMNCTSSTGSQFSLTRRAPAVG